MHATRNRWVVVPALLASLAAGPGCLKTQGGAVESEEEEKSFIVGRWAFRRLEATEMAIAEKDYVKAREKLAEMQENEDLNDHEKALMWQLIGNIYVDEKNYPEAVKALRKCLDLDALPEHSQEGVQYNLGQLYAVTGDYKASVELLETWIKGQKKPPAREIQLMLANSHVQLGQFEKALHYAEAVVKATETPDENLLQLQLAIHVELKHFEQVVVLLTDLIERFPKKAYWMQLAAAHSQLGDDRRALAVMELAHRQGMLTNESELIRLAQHYLHLELPLKAAELLQGQIDEGKIEKTPDNLELLANSWMAAREPKKAIDALSKAAKTSENGELFFRLGQLQMQQEKWGQAQAAFQRAIAKGNLRDVGMAYVLMGNCNYELGKRAAARQAFQKAKEHDSSRKSAESWLNVMTREDESCPTGGEAACKLIPGRS